MKIELELAIDDDDDREDADCFIRNLTSAIERRQWQGSRGAVVEFGIGQVCVTAVTVHDK